MRVKRTWDVFWDMQLQRETDVHYFLKSQLTLRALFVVSKICTCGMTTNVKIHAIRVVSARDYGKSVLYIIYDCWFLQTALEAEIESYRSSLTRVPVTYIWWRQYMLWEVKKTRRKRTYNIFREAKFRLILEYAWQHDSTRTKWYYKTTKTN